jgi:hypothetical protein
LLRNLCSSAEAFGAAGPVRHPAQAFGARWSCSSPGLGIRRLLVMFVASTSAARPLVRSIAFLAVPSLFGSPFFVSFVLRAEGHR